MRVCVRVLRVGVCMWNCVCMCVQCVYVCCVRVFECMNLDVRAYACVHVYVKGKEGGSMSVHVFEYS